VNRSGRREALHTNDFDEKPKAAVIITKRKTLNTHQVKFMHSKSPWLP
jgi:hypothetical protein